MTKLWQHVGPGKTGTTTIQRFFQQNRKVLRERGVLYPATPKNDYSRSTFAHHFMPFAIQGDNADLVRSFLTGALGDMDIVLSSERFWNAGPRIVDALSGFDTTVIFYARSPVDRATSLAQQLIKSGAKTYAQISKSPPIPRTKEQIVGWRSLFGKERVSVRKFARDAFPDGDLIADFFSAIGHPEAHVGLPRNSWNQSISLEAAQRIDQHRTETGDKSFIQSGDARFSTAGGTKFRLPEPALKKVRNKTAADLQWLKAEYSIDFSV